MNRTTKHAFGLLLMVFTLSFSQTLSAQVKTRPDSVSTKPYWEIATDLLWLIDKNSVPASSIFFRRNVPQSNGKNTALRVRAGLETEYELRRVISTDIPSDSFFTYKPVLNIGYQVGKSKGQYAYFYGLDLLGSGFQQRQELLGGTLEEPVLFKRNIWQLNVGASVFCGFKWKLIKGLSISIESHFTGIYTRYRYKEGSGLYGFEPTGFADDRTTRFTTRIRPLQVINLSYNFTKSQ